MNPPAPTSTQALLLDTSSSQELYTAAHGGAGDNADELPALFPSPCIQCGCTSACGRFLDFRFMPYTDEVTVSQSAPMQVPQRTYRVRGQNYYPAPGVTRITFDTEDGPGFSVRDGLDKNYAALLGRDELMTNFQPQSGISIRIEWPGYEPFNRQVKTKTWAISPEVITLAKLATEVCKSLSNFIQFGVPATHEDGIHTHWIVGPNNITVENLMLVAIEQVSRSSWQPVVFVI